MASSTKIFILQGSHFGEFGRSDSMNHYGSLTLKKPLKDYLGGEGAILNAINGVPIQGSWWSCTCCLTGTPFTIATLRFCKKATLQV